MSDTERIEFLINYLKMVPLSFSKSLGYDRADKIYNILKGRNKISADVARDITTIYDNVSYDWLLNGKGEMLKKELSGKEILMEQEPEYKTLSSQEIISRLVVQNDKLIAIIERHSVTIENLSKPSRGDNLTIA